MKTFDILDFERVHAADILNIASRFRPFGVTPTCVLSTVLLAASGRAFIRASRGEGRAICNVGHWLLTAARRLLEREFRPTGFASLNDEAKDGISLSEWIPTPEADANVWQRADEAGLSDICDALEGGTAAYALRHGVTRRRAQQVFAHAARATTQLSLLGLPDAPGTGSRK